MRWLDRLRKRGGGAPRNFLRDVMSVVTTRVALFLFIFLAGVLVARLLGTEGRGLVAALMLAPTIVLSLCELGLQRSTAFHIGQKKAPLDEIVANVAGLGALTSVLAIAGCALFLWLTWLPEYTWLLAALAVASVPGTIARSYSAGVFLGLQQIGQFNRSDWLQPFLRLLFIAALAGLLGWGVEGVLGAYVLAAVAAGVYAIMRVRAYSPVRIALDRELAGNLIKLGFGYAGSLFIMTLLYRINFLILQQTGSLEDLGLYTLGANLAEYIWQIPGAMSAVIFARGANARDGESFTRKVLILFRWTILGAIVASIGFAIVGPFFIPFVYGSAFSESAIVLNTMLPGVTAFTAYRILHQDLSSKGRPWISLVTTIPAIALNIAVGLWLIPLYGAAGAGMASSITYAAAALMFVVVYARAMRLPISSIVLFQPGDWTFMVERVPPLKRIAGRVRRRGKAKTDEPEEPR